MSTRSTIAIKYVDNMIRQVYCHSDGYLSEVGRVLKTHYNNQDAITLLLGMGDISVLGDSIESSTFYIRDRSAPLEECESSIFYGLDQFVKFGQEQEFNYMFDVSIGKWLVSSNITHFTLYK